MHTDDTHQIATRLAERVRERLTLDARARFILLFALFNAMFCLLFLLLLQNRQLSEHIETVEATAAQVASEATAVAGEATRLAATRESGSQVESPPSILGISPNTGVGTAGLVEVTVQGSGFVPGTSVEMLREGWPPLAAMNVKVISSTEIACVLDLSRTAPGMWNIRVTNPDQQSSALVDVFKVYLSEPP